MSVRTIVTAMVSVALSLGAASQAHAEMDYDYDRIVISTDHVEKISAAPPGWGDVPEFSVEKQRAFYCYLEENPYWVTNLMFDASEKGWTNSTREVITFKPSDCFDSFLEVAAKPQYQDDPYDLYSTEYEWDHIYALIPRYVASCAWETDPEAFGAALDGVENPSGIWPYLRSGYSAATFKVAGKACLPAFDTFEASDSLFRYNFIQQMLLRKELDE